MKPQVLNCDLNLLQLLFLPNVSLVGPLTSTSICLSNALFSTLHPPPPTLCFFTFNSGHFSHSSAVTCDAIRALAFGRSSWDSRSDSPTVGQAINFTCEEGRVLVGASAIVCQENATYDSQPPVCLSKCDPSLFVAVLFTPQQK